MKDNLGRLYQSTKDGLVTHIVDSTALMVASTPAFATFETMVAGMPNENSLNARLLATGLTYLGLGRLFTKGMDISRKIFKMVPSTPEKLKQVHDAAYAVAYNAVISPAFYYVAGVRDAQQIAVGTLCAMGLAAVLGGPMGYAVDSYRDLTGIKASERLPKIIKKQNRIKKYGLAGLVAAASIGATCLVYEVNNHIQIDKKPKTIIEQVDYRRK